MEILTYFQQNNTIAEFELNELSELTDMLDELQEIQATVENALGD